MKKLTRLPFLMTPLGNSISNDNERLIEEEIQHDITEENSTNNNSRHGETDNSEGNQGYRKSDRTRKSLGYLNDYIHQVNQSSSIGNSLKTPYPISDLLSCDSLT